MGGKGAIEVTKRFNYKSFLSLPPKEIAKTKNIELKEVLRKHSFLGCTSVPIHSSFEIVFHCMSGCCIHYFQVRGCS